MKKIIVLLLLLLLIGCSPQQDKDCLDSFCLDSMDYGIEGTITIFESNRGSVKFKTSLIDDFNQLRNIEVEIFTSEWDFVCNTKADYLINSSDEVWFRALKPSTRYIAVMKGTIVVDGEFKDISIAYTEFTTDSFLLTDISGIIDDVRVGSSFVLYDFQLLSNDYYIVSYGVFLFEGDKKIDELTIWGSRDLTDVTGNNNVFDDLNTNTTYTIKLEVIYEIGTLQKGTTIDEFTFTTN